MTSERTQAGAAVQRRGASLSAADQAAREQSRNMMIIIAAGAVVLALSFGVRSVFGGVLEPLSRDFGWPREVFSLSLAIQNLVWGLAQPLFGAIADRYGDRRALWLGFCLYLAGMILCVLGVSPLFQGLDAETLIGVQHLGAGVLVGAGVSGTAFGLVLAVVGRVSPDKTRSQNLGLVTALGSCGQVALPLFAAYLTEAYDWRVMLAVMAALILPMAFFIPFLKAPAPSEADRAAQEEAAKNEAGLIETLRTAFGYTSYNLLVLGFFVCGFHIAFITVHFPAFVSERCGDPALGLQALGVVGFMNIVGAYLAGQLGARFPKPYLLSGIYALRSLAILLFISFPITPTTVLIFAAAIGPLWLSTVPLTSGVVASMFGLRYMGTLYGFVFLSHQLGSFLGVWLGGRLYDETGSYDIVWWVAIGLGIVSALAHLPVNEKPYRAEAAA
ncbi:MAG: MFS transporter [Pseudomonadota bacterium]